MQTDGSSVKANHLCDLPRNSTNNPTSNSTGDETRVPCAKQIGEDLPRGMIVATTDLQMRSLYEEDERQVGFWFTPVFVLLAIIFM